MAQGGSGRPGGKARNSGNSSGKGSAGGRNQAGRGRSGPQTAAAAQRAIKGARSGSAWRVIIPATIVVVVAAAVVVGVVLTAKHNGNSPSANSNNSQNDSSSAVLASTNGQASGQTVDGVGSNDMEQVLFHVHAHLSMYVDGQAKLLPYGIGIVPPYQLTPNPDGGQFVAGGTKYYWLHTHDESGLIHIESPVQRTYTLGSFFDIWHQPLSTTQVGPAKGKVTAFVNGKEYAGDPRNIPLDAHNVIQLDVGTVVPFANYTFPQNT